MQDTDVAIPVQPRYGSGPSSRDPNPYFGRVLYVPGLALDQPRAVVRFGYVSRTASATVGHPPRTVSLFWSAQGQLQRTACADGASAACVTPGPGGVPDTMAVTVPAQWFTFLRPTVLQASFQGTLLEDKRDGAGTYFRRNRSYDPQTGRFTQEDPIGLAGGINLYGFAGGDPVNFADPFGLCPICVGAYAAFEVGSTLLDLADLAETGVRYLRGDVSGSALSVTAAGVGAGILSFGGGYGRAARMAATRLDDLSAAARSADRGGLSVAGRSLAKHSGRNGSAFSSARGNVTELNSAAHDIVDDILTNPGSTFTGRRSGRFGDVVDIVAPSGRGVRFGAQGNFLHFLEPPRR